MDIVSEAKKELKEEHKKKVRTQVLYTTKSILSRIEDIIEKTKNLSNEKNKLEKKLKSISENPEKHYIEGLNINDPLTYRHHE